MASFQARVGDWMLACFGDEIAADRIERNHRFLEEALELVQANGCDVDDARALVEYVYSRPVGELAQEVGGTMVTLAALCNTFNVDVNEASETELARVWTKVEAIREKQRNKPTGSALPQAWANMPIGTIDRMDDETMADVIEDGIMNMMDIDTNASDWAEGAVRALRAYAEEVRQQKA